MSAQATVTGFVDCGVDATGKQTVIFVPAVSQVDVVQGDKPGEELVTLHMNTRIVTLGPTHSKEFLIKTTLRSPDSGSLIVPEFGKRLGHG